MNRLPSARQWLHDERGIAVECYTICTPIPSDASFHVENRPKQKAAYKKRATLHGAIGGEEQQKRAESILEYQTEVDIELGVEEEKAA